MNLIVILDKLSLILSWDKPGRKVLWIVGNLGPEVRPEIEINNGHLESMNIEVIIEATNVNKWTSGEYVAVVREENSDNAHICRGDQ